MNVALPVIRPQVNDVVMYRGVFGRSPPTRAVVTQLGRTHGQACCHLDDGHWCYFHQIDAIVSDDDLGPLGRGPEPMLDKP